MKKKLSKQFIYKWLQEDTYGEYLLKITNNNFSNRLLLNLWKFFTTKRYSQKGSLITGVQLPRQIAFVSATLRLNALRDVKVNNKKSLCITPSIFSKFKSLFIKTLLDIHKKKDLTLINKIEQFLSGQKKFKRILRFFQLRNLWPWRSFNTFSIGRIKYQWRRRRRIQRGMETKQLLSYNRYHSFSDTETKSNKNEKLLMKAKKNLKKTTYAAVVRSKKTELAKQKKRFKMIKNIFRLSHPRFLKRVKLPVSKLLWRFSQFSKHKKGQSEDIKMLNLTNPIKQGLSLASNWGTLSYKLKQRVNKTLRASKVAKKAILLTAYARLHFKGVYKKPTFMVKKNEVTQLLRFRLLNYFNLVVTELDYSKLFNRLYYEPKVTQLPMPSYFEFHLTPVLLRSGFFENGYVVTSLARRKLFLINGSNNSNTNVALKVWDIVALSNPLWWLVYARFNNFFSSFLNSTSLKKVKAKSFFRRLLKLRRLFRKFNYKSKTKIRGRLSKLVYSKNIVFSLPPSYMEVSYKLFTIIIYKLINKSTDINVPLNLRGLKSVLPSHTIRTF